MVGHEKLGYHGAPSTATRGSKHRQVPTKSDIKMERRVRAAFQTHTGYKITQMSFLRVSEKLQFGELVNIPCTMVQRSVPIDHVPLPAVLLWVLFLWHSKKPLMKWIQNSGKYVQNNLSV